MLRGGHEIAFHVPDIEFFLKVPSKLTSGCVPALSIQPNWTFPPLTEPLTSPWLIHVGPVTSTVPLNDEPFWVNVIVKPPAATGVPKSGLLAQFPLHVPATPLLQKSSSDMPSRWAVASAMPAVNANAVLSPSSGGGAGGSPPGHSQPVMIMQ